MDNSLAKRNLKRKKRVLRVRKRLKGNALTPRLCVFKSNQHIAAQIIDDDAGVTIVGLGTMSKDLRKKGQSLKKSRETAKEVGTKIAQLAKEKNIERVIFDRGRFKYHGLVAELANAAREAGLQF